MLELNLSGYRIYISFSFFAILAFVFCMENYLFTVSTLIACILHELGHLAVLRMYGIKSSAILLYSGGMKIKYERTSVLSVKQDIIVLLAGITVNFIIASISFVIDENIFCVSNLMICVYNLLPFKYFDGGQIISKLKENTFSSRKWILINFLRFCFSVFTIILCFLLYFRNYANLSLFITLIYISISEFITI